MDRATFDTQAEAHLDLFLRQSRPTHSLVVVPRLESAGHYAGQQAKNLTRLRP